MSAIFISHASEDAAEARRLKDWLLDEGYEQIFLDSDRDLGIRGGAEWREALYDQLRKCLGLIALVSPSWMGSQWCRAEELIARAEGKPLFPVVIGLYTSSDQPLGDLQHIDLTADRSDGLARLKRALLDARLDPTDLFTPDLSRSPYPGMLAYEEEDAAVFFGRTEEIRDFLGRLERDRQTGAARFNLILGASGSGKSSFLKAGILPRLRKRPEAWLPLSAFRPEGAPLSAFARALTRRLKAPDRAPLLTRLQSALDPGEEASALAELKSTLRDTSRQHQATPVIAIDQAEELFDRADPLELLDFGRLISAATEGGWTVIATLRSDFLIALQNSTELGHLVESGQLWPLGTVKDVELGQVVEGPTRHWPIELESGLSAALLRDTVRSDALPLLALTLRELYERRENGKRMTVGVYHHLGRIDGVVRTVAEQALPDLSEEDERILRDAFIPAMVRINEEGEFVRRQALWKDLPARAHSLLEHLVQARLLVSSRTQQDNSGDAQERWIDIAHEALFQQWPLLKRWLEQDRGYLQVRQGLRDAAVDWDRSHRRDSYVTHRSDRLESAEEMARHHQFASRLELFEREYLEQAVALRTQRQQRDRSARNRVWGLIGLVALAVLAGGVGVALQSIENLKNQSRLLASRANLANAQSDHALAKLLALEALPAAQGGLRPTVPDAEAELREAILFDRLQKVLHGHEKRVWSVAFSPDGSHIVTASADHTARVWNAQSGAAVAILRGHQNSVVSAAFSPDGNRIVTTSLDNTARLWDARSGRETFVLSGHKDLVPNATFSPDNRLVMSASYDATARIWDTNTGDVMFVLRGHESRILNATFSPNGKFVVTASQDGTARLWDSKNGNELAILSDHESRVQHAAFSPDSSIVVTSSGDKSARLWKVPSGESIAVLQGHDDLIIRSTFSRDGIHVSTASEDGTVRVWSVANGELGVTLRGHEGGVSDIEFSPDGDHIATASNDGTVRLWNTESGTTFAVLIGHEAQVSSVTFDIEGKRIATASSDRTVRIWNAIRTDKVVVLRSDDSQARNAALTSDGRSVASVFTDKIAKVLSKSSPGFYYVVKSDNRYWVNSADFNRDRSRVAFAQSDGIARIFDINTGEKIATLRGHEGGVQSVSFSPDGNLITTASADKSVRIWVASTGKEVRVLGGHKGWVRSAEFSHDSRFIVTTSDDGTVRTWDVRTGVGKIVLHNEKGIVRNATFSSDSTRIAIMLNDSSARILDAASGESLVVLKGHEDTVLSASFSAGDDRMVTTSADKTARLWDTASGKEIAIFFGHESLVRSATFSPDGRRLITASSDKTARLWDTANGKEIAVLRGHERRLLNATFSREGGRILTVSDDYIARLWDAESRNSGSDLVSEACARLAAGRRALTPFEASAAFLSYNPVGPCDRYGPGHWRFYWSWFSVLGTKLASLFAWVPKFGL